MGPQHLPRSRSRTRCIGPAISPDVQPADSARTRSTARRSRDPACISGAPTTRTRTPSTSARTAPARSRTPNTGEYPVVRRADPGRRRRPDGRAARPTTTEYDRGDIVHLTADAGDDFGVKQRSRSSTALQPIDDDSTARPYEQDFTIPNNAPCGIADVHRGRRRTRSARPPATTSSSTWSARTTARTRRRRRHRVQRPAYARSRRTGVTVRPCPTRRSRSRRGRVLPRHPLGLHGRRRPRYTCNVSAPTATRSASRRCARSSPTTRRRRPRSRPRSTVDKFTPDGDLDQHGEGAA